MTLLLQFLFFGVSLQSYYFHSIRMPVFSVASLLIMGLVFWIVPQDNLRIPRYPTSYIFLAYIFILFWSLVGLAFYGEVPDVKRFASFLIILPSILVVSILLKKVAIEKLLVFFLSVHVFFFFLQFIVYYVIGHAIDFLQPLTGEEQRVFGGSFTFKSFGNRFMRASGLYSEPGTYATFVAPMIALFYRWHDHSQFGKKLFWVSLTSLVLSMSTYGCVFAITIALTAKKVRKSIRLFVVGALSLIILPYLYYRFVWMASLGYDTGFGIRQSYIHESFQFLFSDPLGFIFGADLLSMVPRIKHGMADNDVGLLFYMLQFTGVPLTLLFCAINLFLLRRLDAGARNAFLIIMFSKQSLFAPFFVFAIALILWRSRIEDSAKKEMFTLSREKVVFT